MAVVRWEIDIISEPDKKTGFIDLVEVAREARNIQLDPESIATVFDVIDEKGRKFRIDLSEIDSAIHCMRCGKNSDELGKWNYFGKVCSDCARELSDMPMEDYKNEIYYFTEVVRINSDANLDTVERQIEESSEMIKYWTKKQTKLSRWFEEAKRMSRNQRITELKKRRL